VPESGVEAFICKAREAVALKTENDR
jgi:hypothetical protein